MEFRCFVYTLSVGCLHFSHSAVCYMPRIPPTLKANGNRRARENFHVIRVCKCVCGCCNQNHNSRTSNAEIRAYVNWIKDRCGVNRTQEQTRHRKKGKRPMEFAHQTYRHNFFDIFAHVWLAGYTLDAR